MRSCEWNKKKEERERGQPNCNGLQPTSDGLQPKRKTKRERERERERSERERELS